MNAQKLSQVNPDLHEKYKKIMDMDLQSTSSQPPSDSAMNSTEMGKPDEEKKEEQPQEKLLMEHADDGITSDPTQNPPVLPVAEESMQEKAAPVLADSSLENNPEPANNDQTADTVTSSVSAQPSESTSPVNDSTNTQASSSESSDANTPVTKDAMQNQEPSAPAASNSLSNEPQTLAENAVSGEKKELGENDTSPKPDSYEKILEKNLDEMAASPQSSGITQPETQSQPQATEPTPATQTTTALPTDATVGKPVKKTSLLTEIMFAILGLIVLAVYTIIWMKLLNYKI